ncbi:cytochrome b5-like heme/steroid binding domain-containing protein [Triangularia setosa]|uniref:Cytochrome b5-like heme/steroid binding domain-containing protein n=1 Tax=Triangularia setosa TaxID=2587417 RepID=A0AAN7AAC3_9PEZI|nr:cytochrome b5-like heme/steroid binding domain-containing protein [Podospora setosa]
MTEITSAQLERHNTVEDLWVAVNGYVYNLTSFATDHPGGKDILIECAGTDATEPYDYAGHGNDATRTMQKFRVGELAGYRHNKTGIEMGQMASTTGLATAGESQSSWTAKTASEIKSTLLLPTLMSGLALFGLRLFLRAPREEEGQQSFIKLTSMDSFFGGFAIATAFCLAGLGYAYNEFNRALKSEKEVSDYPALIPRRRH